MLSQATDNFIIFTVNGGAGKNVMATAVVKAIKREYPEWNIVVVTAHKDIWLYNPYIYRSYQYGNMPHFYQDFVKNKNVKIFNLEPYNTQDYILKQQHLIPLWCNLCGVEYKGENIELFFNNREAEFFLQNTISLIKQPIMVIQCNGGGPSDLKYSWMRDMPLSVAQEVVNHFANKYKIVHIRREDQLPLQNVDVFKGNIRELMLLIRFSKKRLFIDSVSQHIAASFNLPSVVTWVRNTPEMLGYSIHTNIITTNPDELDTTFNSFLEQYDIAGAIYQSPFKEGTQLFNSQEIIAALENIKD